MSIVGRYLEHSRIYYFQNGGQEELYIGSADWMTRNLDRRVEAVAPIETPSLKEELKMILNILLEDQRQGWDLESDGVYRQRTPLDETHQLSSQEQLMALAIERDQVFPEAESDPE